MLKRIFLFFLIAHKQIQDWLIETAPGDLKFLLKLEQLHQDIVHYNNKIKGQNATSFSFFENEKVHAAGLLLKSIMLLKEIDNEQNRNEFFDSRNKLENYCKEHPFIFSPIFARGYDPLKHRFDKLCLEKNLQPASMMRDL